MRRLKRRNGNDVSRNVIIASAAAGALATVLMGATGAFAPASAQSQAPSSVTAPPGAPLSFADIVEKVAPAVVSIDVESKPTRSPVAMSGPEQAPFSFGVPGPGGQGFTFRFPQQPNDVPAQPQRATGSGFFISGDGYVVTNNHVVDGADKITVRTKDGRKLPAHVVGVDPATDLAVVKVDGAGFPFVDFEQRAKPRVGDWVVAVGNPFGLGGTATAGIVSALGRQNVSNSSYVDYMQIDAPINRGNSGGPTFDVEGRVVGVNTAIFSPSGGSVGIGFDIPADVAASVTHQLIAQGKVVRGFIGATVQDVTPEIADSLGVGAKQGALVADVTAGGPSSQAGLKPGDLIEKIDGHEVSSASDLTRTVALARAGDAVHLQVMRGGAVREVDVKSGIRPTEASFTQGAGPDQGGAGPQTQAGRVLGMQLQPNPGGGVAIAGLAADSDALQKGLQPGDVIVQAGDRQTATPADVAAAVTDARRAGRKAVLLLIGRDGRNLFVALAVGDAKG
jgi:serine protease Do